MPKIIQINTGLTRATGKIMNAIGDCIIHNGWDSYVAVSANSDKATTQSNYIEIGSVLDSYSHALQCRIFDNVGLNSKQATKNFLNVLNEIKPDIIHLHNIHNYFINYRLLFDYIKKNDIPVLWTLHDCWSFTGHCAYFDSIYCNKWKTGCHDCQLKGDYPTSWLIDRSKKNWIEKRDIFTHIQNITFVPVSEWIGGFLKNSFFKDYPYKVIHNGIDLNVFKPIAEYASDNVKQLINKVNGRKIVLGVALPWTPRKGLHDMIKLYEMLDPTEYAILLIGLSQMQIKQLPSGIYGYMKTLNQAELAEFYNIASVFVNPTYSDNLPTTNIEALACGTPVITYKTGGSPEILDENTGIVVEQGNIEALVEVIKNLQINPLSSKFCRKRAEVYFDKDKCFDEYIHLYEELLAR